MGGKAIGANPHLPRRLEGMEKGDYGIPDGGFEAVEVDLTALMTDSQDFWPADFGE